MSMLATAFWRRLDVPGHDAAALRQAGRGFELSGQAVFLDPRGPAALRYRLRLGADWSTAEGRIAGFVGDHAVNDRILRLPQGWRFNGRDCGMADILDLDLGFTPATNMAQLRRVSLAIGASARFDVAWLEAGDQELQRLPQEYRRSDAVTYCYHSPQGGYRASLVLEPSGFAALYPGLWEIER